MKKKVADNWVAALRSGKYKQGRGFLKQRHDNAVETHCCLGVLCELYLAEHPGSEFAPRLRPDIDVPNSDNGTAYTFGLTGAEAPPVEIREWAGIRLNSCERLAEQNDDGDVTFEDLAAEIAQDAEQL